MYLTFSSQNDPVYSKYLLQQCTVAEIKTIRSAWRKLFADYYIHGDHTDSVVYIVLDGLDETIEEERLLFFELLQDLKSGELLARDSSARLYIDAARESAFSGSMYYAWKTANH
jgi:hypothetical protein